MFDSEESLKEAGFEGFIPIKSLLTSQDRKVVPQERGIYLILYMSKKRPTFVPIGTGGFYRYPTNEDVSILDENWIEGPMVIYIGQAGNKRNGDWSNSTLRKRLAKYMRYGQGKSSPHEGGRNIWQIENCQELVVCWKQLPNKMQKPMDFESFLIKLFKDYYSDLPFANWIE